jgi:hypothetical protein
MLCVTELEVKMVQYFEPLSSLCDQVMSTLKVLQLSPWWPSPSQLSSFWETLTQCGLSALLLHDVKKMWRLQAFPISWWWEPCTGPQYEYICPINDLDSSRVQTRNTSLNLPGGVLTWIRWDLELQPHHDIVAVRDLLGSNRYLLGSNTWALLYADRPAIPESYVRDQ